MSALIVHTESMVQLDWWQNKSRSPSGVLSALSTGKDHLAEANVREIPDQVWKKKDNWASCYEAGIEASKVYYMHEQKVKVRGLTQSPIRILASSCTLPILPTQKCNKKSSYRFPSNSLNRSVQLNGKHRYSEVDLLLEMCCRCFGPTVRSSWLRGERTRLVVRNCSVCEHRPRVHAWIQATHVPQLAYTNGRRSEWQYPNNNFNSNSIIAN